MVVSRHLCLILLSKISLFIKLVRHTSKNYKNSTDSKYVLIIFSSFSGCWVFNYFVFFHWIKVSKHIWEPCCHLVAKTGSWFSLIIIESWCYYYYYNYYCNLQLDSKGSLFVNAWQYCCSLIKPYPSGAPFDFGNVRFGLKCQDKCTSLLQKQCK